MEKLFNDFGFEWTFFIAQIINFLILAIIFKKFLYKPILKVLHDRAEKIAQGLADAEASTKALEKAEERKNEIIKAATLEAEKIIDETKKSAEEMRDELSTKAKKEADKIIEEARATAAEEVRSMENQAKDAALTISKKIVDRILSEIFTKDEREIIISRDVKKIADYE